MRLSRSISPVAQPALRSGVALIVTVIMLAVITFLAVAFLALSGREKNAVKGTTDQTTARLAADTALVRAESDLLAGFLASRNLASGGFLVSTTYVSWGGFTNNVDDPVNVNYEYLNTGGALNNAQALQNLANLLYNPRPPVFITNRYAANSMEFRYYMDINRNGRPDRNGLWRVTNSVTGPIILTNGLYASNYAVGDPEWIGATERIEFPHSSSNKFVQRFAYVVAPIGNTLDLNYIYNNAKNPGVVNYFLRNQGVGSWELNLAAFLMDLNTNYWSAFYQYRTNVGLSSIGVAFDDAYSLWNWRRGGLPQKSVLDLYGTRGESAFQNDWFDGYSAGLVKNNFQPYLTDPDDTRTRNPWSGAEMPNHFFSIQDLFDTTKTGTAFSNRMGLAVAQTNTYDQYTFARLLAQLGTDSAPDDANKLNLNYVSLPNFSATNFIAWTDTPGVNANFPGVAPSDLFFTNAADRLLRAYTEEWIQADASNYLATYFGYIGYTGPNDPVFGGKVSPFGITNIPVSMAGIYSPTNQTVSGNRVFTYTPAVHRILQIAANIWDAQANRRDAFGALPTTFVPQFGVSNKNIYITGFAEAQNANNLSTLPPLDSSLTNSVAFVLTNSLIYGVPPVIGARKGLPNFNEYSAAPIFTLTRKIQLRKSGTGGQDKIIGTNQLFTVDVFMDSGIEFWNSYQATYFRDVDVLVTNRITMALKDRGTVAPPTVKTFVVAAMFNTNQWVGWKDYEYSKSFVVPLRTNITFLPTITYRPDSGQFGSTNLAVFAYDDSQSLRFPSWVLSVTNRVQAMILDRATREIIDYVLLGEMDTELDLAAEIGRAPALGLPGLWSTNNVSGRPGVLEQIRISKGVYPQVLDQGEWTQQAQDARINDTTISAAQQIANFLAYFTPNQRSIFTDPSTGISYRGTNDALVAEVPFTPSVKIPDPWSWQANDPLVHYNAKDMLYVAGVEAMEENKRRIKPPQKSYAQIIAGTELKEGNTLGSKNQLYKPWDDNAQEGDANAVDPEPGPRDITLKDPLVKSSDDWQFPTNKFATLGWLGLIHRGTPWQTIYMKASDMGLSASASNYVSSPLSWALNYQSYAKKWAKWTGNRTLMEGFYTRPVSDRVLFDVFTTALNENASRGQLSINQTNLAAWSALFSGVVVLSNASLTSAGSLPSYAPDVIRPAGIYDAQDASTWPPLVSLVHGINAERMRTDAGGNFVHRGGWFEHVGDLLAVPELTERSPFLNTNGLFTLKRGISEAAYEWLPRQIMSLVKVGEPRFVVYAFGQALRPAENSIVTAGGQFFGLCTNYQITAEVAARAVVRVEGSANPNDKDNPILKRRYPPRLIIESYNYLPPD